MPKPVADPPVARLRPAVELLLCCARTCLDAESAARIQALLRRQDLDWVSLLRTAALHGLMPLLYQNLQATCPDAVPQATLEMLRDYFHANELRNCMLTEELLTLLRLLEAHGIPTIPFKGPVLAAAVYGNLALRQFSDLDILVHARDFLRATDVLRAQGYRFWIPLTATQAAAWGRSQHAYTLVRTDGRMAVDLHWRMTPRYFPFPLDLAHLQEHLEPVDLLGTRVSSLSPEDLLVFLCVHGAKHAWARLAWLCDVAELLRARPGIDWGRVQGLAATLHSRRRLALGLLLARDLLGVRLPPEVLHQIQGAPSVQGLAVRVRDQLFRQTDAPAAVVVSGVVKTFLLQVQVLDRLQDQVRCALHPLAPPVSATLSVKDRAFLPLPTSLAFLYALVRPLRLVSQYGRSLVEQLVHSRRQ